MIKNIITSTLAFASTNIDDFFILVLFFGSKRFKTSHIFLGQYVGIFALVLISFAFSFVSQVVDQRIIGLLGIFPMYLGIKQALSMWGKSHAREQENSPQIRGGILAIGGTTIANGGDNIGVYVPLLSAQSAMEKFQFMVVFGVMVFAWCALARYTARHPALERILEKAGHLIMPIILFLLGWIILIGSGTISWLAAWLQTGT